MIFSLVIESITDCTPLTIALTLLLVPTILAVKLLERFRCDITLVISTSFCFSSPNVIVIVAFFSLIALTPLGLLIVTL